MFPILIISLYSNIAPKPTYTDGNTNSLTGTRQKIGRMGDKIYARSLVTGLWSVLNSTLPAGSSGGGLVYFYDDAYEISGRTLYRFD